MVFFSYWNQYVGIYWLRGTREVVYQSKTMCEIL
jgi:hypothetical protein